MERKLTASDDRPVSDSAQDLDKDALEYHRLPPKGKLAIRATKPLSTQRDLSLAYSPGVAAACRAIEAVPGDAAEYTARGNLIGVISNGTAVLGLGSIGALASKPVMEGKAVLFKKFAGIDVFDIEVDETDIDRFCDIVAALEPTFGGINLEDIKAPECFEIERRLRERMNIPVFHDDQHGTAIIVAAAVYNGLKFVRKSFASCRIVCSGAGAAAIACLNMLVALGARRENITVCDANGVIYKGRQARMDCYKEAFAQDTEARVLGEVIEAADVFLGLSAAGVLKPDMVEKMADSPLIFALANPVPEIMPEIAKAVRSDAIIGTGRSDYPNQINNVLCFPFIFRGALDVGATVINEEMKVACALAIAELAHQESIDVVARAYTGESLSFGSDYLIPKPFDPRLIVEIAPAVAQAAIDSGCATRPISDMLHYKKQLMESVYKSGSVMKPVFDSAARDKKRIAFGEGEEERTLRAIQVVVDEGLAYPVLIGRARVVRARIKKLGLRLKAGKHFELCDPENDPRFREYWELYHHIMGRKGVSPARAQTIVRTNNTVIGALMLRRYEVDAFLCGTVGSFSKHLQYVCDIIGLKAACKNYHTSNILLTESGALFLADTHVSENPDARELAEIGKVAAELCKRFGLVPKIAFLSHSNFGSSVSEQATKVRDAVEIMQYECPDLEVDGEMHADTALDEELRSQFLTAYKMQGRANVLIMPNLDAANIAYNLVKMTASDGFSIGPYLSGAMQPVHVLTSAVSTRGIVNMVALAAVDAQMHKPTAHKKTA